MFAAASPKERWTNRFRCSSKSGQVVQCVVGSNALAKQIENGRQPIFSVGGRGVDGLSLPRAFNWSLPQRAATGHQ